MLLVLQIQAVFAAAWGGDWLLHVPGRDLKYGAEACPGQLVIGGEQLLLPSPLFRSSLASPFSLAPAPLLWFTADLCICACAGLSMELVAGRCGHEQGPGLV